MRAVKGSTVSLLSDRYEGTPSAPSATVTRADGTALPAPSAAVSNLQAAVTLTAADHLDELDRLTVVITATVGGLPDVQTHEVDVIGSYWITVGSLRGEPDLSDLARFPAALVAEIRDEWEAHLEDLCNVRMVPGYEVEHHIGNGRNSMELRGWAPRVLRSVLIDGAAVPITDFTLSPLGTVFYDAGTFSGGKRVEIHYEAGYDRPPAKLVREVRKAVRRELLWRAAKGPHDAISEAFDGGGIVRYSTPDPRAGRFTGILTLDPVIAEYRQASIGVA